MRGFFGTAKKASAKRCAKSIQQSVDGGGELNYNLTMKRVFFSLLLTATLLTADGGREHAALPYAESVALLQGIRSDAIVLGEGKTEVYVFVDPLCPHSRKFMTMVSGNAKMLTKYKYYIFLYSIPRLRSEGVVSAIYTSEKPLDLLLKIMVDKQTPQTGTFDGRVGKTVADIAAVARALDVYKRPYIIVAVRQ